MKGTAGAIKLGRLDLKILDKPQADVRITNRVLADAVGLSPSLCLERLKHLLKAGIIASYRTPSHRNVDVISAVTLRSHGRGF